METYQIVAVCFFLIIPIVIVYIAGIIEGYNNGYNDGFYEANSDRTYHNIVIYKYSKGVMKIKK